MQLFSGIKDKFIEYLDVRLKLLQISVEEKVSDLIAQAAYALLLLMVAFISVVFFMLVLANLINMWTHTSYAGYGVVGVLCVFLLWILGKKKSQEFIISKVREKTTLTIKKP